MAHKDLHGGSTNWWPPSGDHVILYKANPLRFEHFDRFLESWAGVKVLDVGCGGGYTCEYLAERKALVFGTDILDESLQEARGHAVQEDLKIEYRLGTPERLPFDDREMDVVTCFDVLEHIPDKGRTLGEIERVLKPGGWLFFDTVNKTFLARLGVIWFGEILLRFVPRGTHHWSLFAGPEELKHLLEKVGFKEVDFAGIKFDLRARARNGLPVRVASNGNTAVIYFGAARKPIH
ncbi:MAG: 3-demethylubiquinone-9 3-O-methyltransferase [Deltaproteobacteria bacterium]|nr:3-demethylubiquinone-9 3-O-methyltransferase [Deltaproteobacteria bacterium]